VLVERVEGFASPQEWMRAYVEINDFEEQLREQSILLKFWLHIDPDEQLKRFRERETIAYKQYKITEDDYRNREKWPQYEQAVNDMVERTSTEFAPWTLIEANNKRYARIKALKTWCEALEARLDNEGVGR
jgi:AMP-polyphosphate phosphotransferase